MKRKHIRSLLISVLSLLFSACNSVSTQPVTPMGTDLTPTATNMPTSTPPTPSVIQLPASSRLGAVLTGSGDVERSLLTYDDLMTGSAGAPVDDGAFALPEAAAASDIIFEGSLQLSTIFNSGFKVIRDDLNYAAEPGRFQLPDLDLQFVQDGSSLVPVTQGLVYSGNPYWNYIIGPGRIWQEDGDHGYARASFPFTLVERNQNCTHNGVMTFLFNGTDVSPVLYQVTQETCLYFKFDLWGRTAATYRPGSIPQAAEIKTAHAMEVENRLPTKPISALEVDFPDSGISLTRFGSGITPENMTSYGLVFNGVNYISGCRTRYGEYAYCESLRLPSYSTAKSAFAGMALMLLGQKYGNEVADLLIRDYVPESAEAAGDWTAVTFRNTLDMTTGNYGLPTFEADEVSPLMVAFLDGSETYVDKITAAFRFPYQRPPGQLWIYHTSDTFILTRAMNNFLVAQEGSQADIFNLLRDEVFIPLHLSTGAMTSLRTDNSSTGAPFGGYGLFWTQDDIARLALFLNVQQGIIGDEQVLSPDMLAAAMQRDPEDRGLDTSGAPVFKYNFGFWAKHWTPSEFRRYSCDFWTPFMSGYGGISVVMMPNGAIYYYFSDNNEFAWYDAVNEAGKLSPMCP